MNDSDCKTDPILEELHSIRRQIHDECQGDLELMVAEMRSHQVLSGHPIATLSDFQSQELRAAQ
jgi:hypothetical protein